jgi:probable rRNA maturation factor
VIALEVDVAEPRWRALLPDAVALVEAAGAACPDVGEAAVLLTSDEAVAGLNARFRGKDGPTNVLSFPAIACATVFLGDIALALGVCEREAREQAKPLADHLQHLVVHGLLHLMGYDHQDDATGDVMEDLERRILSALGVPDPYGRA